MTLKKQVLDSIYSTFEAFAAEDTNACFKGCSLCCSQNVTIAAIEAEKILNYIREQGLEKWFAQQLSSSGVQPERPKITLNAFARSCMEGKDEDQLEPAAHHPCPFLIDHCCGIYPVRPFSCRCFLSMHQCSRNEPAVVSERYLAAATAIGQLIEHLGQREQWGNMLDVLTVMLDSNRYSPIADFLQDRARIATAGLHTLTAQPLPGFLLSPEEQAYITPLLEDIFSREIEGRSVEDILNGR